MVFGTEGLTASALPAQNDVEVSSHTYRTEAGSHIATTHYVPSGIRPTAVAWALAGGGCNRNFWDIEVAEAPLDAYSTARHLAERGVAVITADHLGTGESTRPPAGPLTTAESLARHMDDAARQARHDDRFAGLPFVGLGHSFGAGMTLVQQANHRTFDAIALLGWSSIQLAIVYRDGSIRAVGSEGDRASIIVTNLGFDADPRLIEANLSVKTPMVAPALEYVTTPGNLVAASRGVRVPVYLGFGEFDTLLDVPGEAALYVAAPHVSVGVLPGSYHFLPLQPGHERVWGGLIRFIRTQVAWPAD
jgi:pimeloyl-ACP methyl ester carboxylesterase